MSLNKILLLIGVIVILVLGSLYVYLIGLASMYNLNTPDERPFFITTEPIKVKNIVLPIETKITYKQNYFWQKHKQAKLLNENNIVEISFKNGTTIDWGGVPVSSIVNFFNSEKSGYTLYADFNKLIKKNETEFSKLWKNCSKDIGITVSNSNDWSFNKKNILNIENCGVNYQRYYKENKEQQRFLDNLHDALKEISE